ncbi:MAG TPA: AraC family transcriptional regulator, partial [Burkholderiaceae bacterium]
NGVTLDAQQPLEFANSADVVLFGSGMKTREVAADSELMARLQLDPSRQLIGAQCSGTFLLAKLGLLGGVPACTDNMSKPWVREAGVDIVDRPFSAQGNIATAGGCLASPYLAAWVLMKLAGEAQTREILHYVVPVGEKDSATEHILAAVRPYL